MILYYLYPPFIYHIPCALMQDVICTLYIYIRDACSLTHLICDHPMNCDQYSH